MSKPDNQNDFMGEIKVEELICFALYSANHAMNRAYKPHLAKIGLTYPQYITLTALWDVDGVTVGALCDRLMIETSTLTPLLKRLEGQGLIERQRSREDERRVLIHLTKAGASLRKHAPDITTCIIHETGEKIDELADLVRRIGTMRDALLENRNLSD